MINEADLNETLNNIILERVTKIRTTTIGKITKLNGNTINVQPLINASVQGQSVQLPEFIEVPFVTIQGGGSYLSMPFAVGDDCLLLVAERNIDNWWVGENLKPPREYQIHDYSNTFAIVGINSSKNTINIPDVINMIGDAFIQGNHTIEGNHTHTGNYTLNGNLTVNGNIICSGTISAANFTGVGGGNLETTVDIVSNGISLQTHVHGGVQSGGNNTNPPS